MSSPRRYFWGNSLNQAVMAAARHHQVDPAALAYRIHEKRHGFLRHPRKVVIEVDPAAPSRVGAETPAAVAPAIILPPIVAPRRPRAEPAIAGTEPVRAAERRGGRGSARGPGSEGGGQRSRDAEVGSMAPETPRDPRPPRSGAREPGAGFDEAWEAPDEESAFAAGSAARTLLRFAGLDVEPEIRATAEALEVELGGPDAERITHEGLAWLDHFDHLLPRMTRTLSGKLVRIHSDCGGLRGARDTRLRELALAGAAEVVATGGEHLLPPLSSAERRVVHVTLADRDDVETESVGHGPRKRVLIRRRAG